MKNNKVDSNMVVMIVYYLIAFLINLGLIMYHLVTGQYTLAILLVLVFCGFVIVPQSLGGKNARNKT